MKSSAISAPVTAVTTPIASEITQSLESCRLVRLASFTAASTMIAVTAGAIP
jgi:hypothetical protein